MAGAGSGKRFWRIGPPGQSRVLMVNDRPEQGHRSLNESDSFLHVHRALLLAGASVPTLFAAWPAQNAFLLEDLGDTTLTPLLKTAGASDTPPPLARRAVALLAQVQVRGRPHLTLSALHNNPYDAAFMRERESGYFLAQWVQGWLGQSPAAGLLQELDALAEAAGRVGGDLLLYRDFQSSNLMLTPAGALALVDFQGARTGPPHYDLASFLYDAYTGFSPAARAALMKDYLHVLAQEGVAPRLLNTFEEDFPLLAVHRAMQAMGAFAKLSRVDGKWAYAGFLPVMLQNLSLILSAPVFLMAPMLRTLVQDVLEKGCPSRPTENPA